MAARRLGDHEAGKPGTGAAPAPAGDAHVPREKVRPASPPPAPPGEPVRVTLVDDDESVHVALAGVLNPKSGWTLDYCSSGLEALTRVQANPPALVLMDIVMPGLSGIECARRMKVLSPSLPIVMLTGSLASAHVLESVAAGAAGYPAKPMAAAGLLSALRLALRGGLALCPEAREVLADHLNRAGDPWALIPREREVATALIKGELPKDIARRCNHSLGTFHTHLIHMFRKTNSRSRAELLPASHAHLLRLTLNFTSSGSITSGTMHPAMIGRSW
jgi:DNA-binding NarL/FixJ family response regulator